MWVVLAQWYEIQRDALMMRTRNRPLPQGRLSPRHALAFAFATGLGGAGILYWQVRLVCSCAGKHACWTARPAEVQI